MSKDIKPEPVSEAAREAAFHRAIEQVGYNLNDEVGKSAHIGFKHDLLDRGAGDVIFDAGVAEGIRRVRATFDLWDEKDGWGQYPNSLLTVFDSLSAESEMTAEDWVEREVGSIKSLVAKWASPLSEAEIDRVRELLISLGRIRG